MSNRARKGFKLDGWINLDKPAGLTSTQALARVKRALKPQKIGHAGTLDPLATGILPLALGEATKTIPYAQDREKTYTFAILWGEARDTDDAEGQVIATSLVRPDEASVRAAMPAFVGDIIQTPPRFSAIKIDGQRAYDLARDGEVIEMKSRPAWIESLELTDFASDRATFRCVCGKGTYMRSLARDLAVSVGTVGHIVDLRRTAVGPFTLENAISLDFFTDFDDSAALDNVLLPLETTLDDIPALALNMGEAAKLRGGQMLSFISRPDLARLTEIGLDLKVETTALALHDGQPVALVTVQGPEIRPVRVLNL
jgi:tRNA pseudouridine55 synthase